MRLPLSPLPGWVLIPHNHAVRADRWGADIGQRDAAAARNGVRTGARACASCAARVCAKARLSCPGRAYLPCEFGCQLPPCAFLRGIPAR